MKSLDARHVLAIMSFLATSSMYMGRLDLSIAVVAMAGGDQQENNNIQASSHCAKLAANSSNIANDSSSGNNSYMRPKVEFDWSTKQKADLLGSYYYGNVLTQILAGWMATKFGFKRVVGYALVICGILSLLTPTVAAAGIWYLMFLRWLLGIFQGFIFTPVTGGWSYWAPPQEYAFLVSFPMAGCAFGVVTVFPLGGVLAGFFGWRSVFYFTGGLSLALSAAWFALVFDRPESHPRITERELKQILAGQRESGGREAVQETPWRQILVSGPVWGMVVSHWASNWGNYQLQMLLPTYLNDILGLDLFSNGFYTGLPYLGQALLTLAVGYLTDSAIASGHISLLTMRKANNFVSLFVPACCLVAAAHAGCNVPVVIGAFVASATVNSFIYGGSQTNLFDFAPRYAAIIYGISNTVAQSSGFMAPQTTGLLLQEANTHSNWQLAFWVSSLVYVPGILAFQFLASAEVQPWAMDKEKEEDRANTAMIADVGTC